MVMLIWGGVDIAFVEVIYPSGTAGNLPPSAFYGIYAYNLFF